MQSNAKTILVVDDKPANISIITSILNNRYKTKVALNGDKALLLVSGADRPNLILLDVVMPGMDGYEVCRRLKSNPETADIPVIFLTARTEPLDEEKGFDVGAVDYIHKPFSAPIVLARVSTHLALQSSLRQAREATAKTDALLHCLLPKVAADEIQEIGTVIPRRHEDVAVLFCDVIGFTAYCETHEPEDVLSQLDVLFLTFEQIAAEHGLEKIKTIGDGFMAAAGLLVKIDSPLEAAIRCGLQMAEAQHTLQTGWTVRVGVHFGPVVSGIIGQARYQFDIWGDTVNVASRLTGIQGEPGGVMVTDQVWERLAPHFRGEARGEVQIKGKGLVSVVQVLGENL